MTGVVIATGSNTFFGKTAKLVASAGGKSPAQEAMFKIGNFLIIVAVVLAVIMVASIPVAMPTVFSITLALGALNLSKKKAIVSRLASIEEMAGVDILCSDKTGTLTKNQLTLGDTTLINAKDAQDVIKIGALASRKEDNDPIDNAVIKALKDQSVLADWTMEKFIPFDPVSKRIEAHLINNNTKEELWAIKGAPQVVAKLSSDPDVQKKVLDTTDALAKEGIVP